MSFNIIMPKMGESIEEATITKWFVKEGDKVSEDDILLEIATDKVDSEIPSPVEGFMGKLLFEEGDLVPVGTVIAEILQEGDEQASNSSKQAPDEREQASSSIEQASDVPSPKEGGGEQSVDLKDLNAKGNRFYSPLVRSIAEKENIAFDELEAIAGTGKDGRLTKDDLLKYLENKGKQPTKVVANQKDEQKPQETQAPKPKSPVKVAEGDETYEMDRVRKIIADHMVMSKNVSPHVTSVIEADVTNLVLWREKVKGNFQEREREKLTYMPVFIEAVAKALKKFPLVNASLDGYKVIKRKQINIGVAVALPNWSLVVPVIKNADQKNLVGLTKDLNKKAADARSNKLGPDAMQGGTFTITNFGTFKNIIGTPIINQPQVAILATGIIEKKPAVLETETGDVIAIRHKMYLSLSYDHRIIDGALGGAFLKQIADYLEGFDINREL